MADIQGIILPPDTRANQPAAASVSEGALYYVTDEAVLERNDGTAWEEFSITGGGSGDVIGPASSVASEAALFDGTSGKLLKRATGTGVVHRTSGVDSVSNIVETEITLADNTTNNVTASAHGFAPKSPGSATSFLNGASPPAWAIPGVNGAAANVATSETQASNTTFGDLTTPGPAVTLTTGSSVIVWLSCNVTHGAAGNSANVSVAISGATTVAAGAANSGNTSASGASHDNVISRCMVITGLTPGSNTFTLKYQNNGGGTWTFYNRSIVVIAL